MKLQSYKLVFLADGNTFCTWHILARNYLEAIHNAQCKMMVYMKHNAGHTVSFEVIAE